MISIQQYYESGELFDGRYKLLRPLSTDGATADVWLAVDMNTVDTNDFDDDDDVVYVNGERVSRNATTESGEASGMQVAIKIYRPKNALDIEGEQRFRDEFKIVYNCHHANLLQPSHFSIFNEVPYLVLPFCRDGSAEKLVEQRPDNETLWKFVGDVAAGLAYLHACQPPIIHQDIKPGNVLLDAHHNFAITDFGISAKFGGNQHLYEEGNAGTLAYMAPERFEAGYIAEAPSDIWALGATLYEIITGQVPFGEDGGMTQPDGPVALQFPKDADASMQRLITACLAKNPADRPTAAYLIEASRQHQYPVKKPSVWPKVIGSLLVVAAIAALVWAFVFRPEPVTIVEAAPARPAEEVFEEAKALLAYDNADSLAAGLALMDSLGAQKYVPALWEMALTYGWFSDAESQRRKQVLGIEVGNTNVADEAKPLSPYLPKLDDYNQRAMSLFARIVESGDSTNLDLQAKAAYTLGVYYVYYTRNMTLAQKQFLKGREFAERQGDADMIETIDAAIQQLK